MLPKDILNGRLFFDFAWQNQKYKRSFFIRLVARGIIKGSKRPFFSQLADPSQQVYFIFRAGAAKYFRGRR
jgi:hypothetical protein